MSNCAIVLQTRLHTTEICLITDIKYSIVNTTISYMYTLYWKYKTIICFFANNRQKQIQDRYISIFSKNLVHILYTERYRESKSKWNLRKKERVWSSEREWAREKERKRDRYRDIEGERAKGIWDKGRVRSKYDIRYHHRDK